MQGEQLTISGVEAVDRAFTQLEYKVARKLVAQAERDALKYPLAQAKQLAPARTGKGRRSLRIRTSKGPRGAPKGTVSMALLIGQGGKPPGETWYMWLQERGWVLGKRIRSGGKVTGRAGRGAGKQIKGKWFMRRSLHQNEARVQQMITANVIAGIERESNKA
jgi:hypothetical protein